MCFKCIFLRVENHKNQSESIMSRSDFSRVNIDRLHLRIIKSKQVETFLLACTVCAVQRHDGFSEYLCMIKMQCIASSVVAQCSANTKKSIFSRKAVLWSQALMWQLY